MMLATISYVLFYFYRCSALASVRTKWTHRVRTTISPLKKLEMWKTRTKNKKSNFLFCISWKKMFCLLLFFFIHICTVTNTCLHAKKKEKKENKATSAIHWFSHFCYSQLCPRTLHDKQYSQRVFFLNVVWFSFGRNKKINK